jgi:predicted  nucleic acid-binding Zn-ribbon protein
MSFTEKQMNQQQPDQVKMWHDRAYKALDEVTRLNKVKNGLEHHLEEMRQKIRTLEDQLADETESKTSKYADDIEREKSAVLMWRERAQQSLSKALELNKLKNVLETKLQEQASKIKTLEDQLTGTQNTQNIQKLQDEYDMLGSELERVKDDKKSLEHTVRTQKAQIEAMNQIIANSNKTAVDNNKAALKEIERANKHATDLQDRLTKAEDKITNLAASLFKSDLVIYDLCPDFACADRACQYKYHAGVRDSTGAIHRVKPAQPTHPTPQPAPQTSAPQTSAPQTSAPQTSAPQTSAPQTSAPQTSAPQTSAPPQQKTSQKPPTPPPQQKTSQKPPTPPPQQQTSQKPPTPPPQQQTSAPQAPTDQMSNSTMNNILNDAWLNSSLVQQAVRNTNNSNNSNDSSNSAVISAAKSTIDRITNA